MAENTQEDLAKVIEELEAQVKESPENVIAHHHLGLVFMKAGRVDDAIHSLEKAIEIDPEYALAHVMLGQATVLMAVRAGKKPGELCCCRPAWKAAAPLCVHWICETGYFHFLNVRNLWRHHPKNGSREIQCCKGIRLRPGH